MDEAMELCNGWTISLRMFLYVIIHVQLELVDLERRKGNLIFFPHVLCFMSFMCC